MHPVDYRSFHGVWRWPKRCKNWLEECQNGGDDPQNGMAPAPITGHPSTDFKYNTYGSGQGKEPREHHQ